MRITILPNLIATALVAATTFTGCKQKADPVTQAEQADQEGGHRRLPRNGGLSYWRQRPLSGGWMLWRGIWCRRGHRRGVRRRSDAALPAGISSLRPGGVLSSTLSSAALRTQFEPEIMIQMQPTEARNSFRANDLGSLARSKFGAPIAMLCLVGCPCIAQTTTFQEHVVNSGEDITAPIDRFDLRMQFKSLEDVSHKGVEFDDISNETLTLRTDLVLFNKPDQLALRFDLPLIWSNKPNNQNPEGNTEFGMGDFLMQAIYVREIDKRWAAGAGLRTIPATATGEAFGDGKWQLVPTVGVRASLPEISEGSYAGLIVRQFSSVGGQSSRKNISYFQFEPQFNIGLPGQWFLNFSPKAKSTC